MKPHKIGFQGKWYWSIPAVAPPIEDDEPISLTNYVANSLEPLAPLGLQRLQRKSAPTSPVLCVPGSSLKREIDRQSIIRVL